LNSLAAKCSSCKQNIQDQNWQYFIY